MGRPPLRLGRPKGRPQAPFQPSHENRYPFTNWSTFAPPKWSKFTPPLTGGYAGLVRRRFRQEVSSWARRRCRECGAGLLKRCLAVPRLQAACSRDFAVVLSQLAYNIAMKIANIAEFKNHLSAYLAAVANGEEIEVRKRNTPFVRVVPIRAWARNRTVLGCGTGTVVVKSDLIDPMIPPDDWNMLGDDPS